MLAILTKKHLNFTVLRKTLSGLLLGVSDFRQLGKVSIDIHDAAMSGFACMFFQDPSLLQFQKYLEEAQHNNNLKTQFDVTNIPKETQIREIIDSVESDFLSPIFRELYSRLQRGKYLEQYQTFLQIYYFPTDDFEFYSSKEVFCDQCLTKKHKAGSKIYFHQVLQGELCTQAVLKSSLLCQSKLSIRMEQTSRIAR